MAPSGDYGRECQLLDGRRSSLLGRVGETANLSATVLLTANHKTSTPRPRPFQIPIRSEHNISAVSFPSSYSTCSFSNRVLCGELRSCDKQQFFHVVFLVNSVTVASSKKS
ncbi:hypothetical protein E2P81_ATG06468 [Venturia nashicola]|uniref:Uncharacterized protein n=1 Tax=Venturia nashicola TaxID=86259 RepID=A0A4Z1PAP2_9PEZI|nr:hypothetical protein E6O75_ATG06632 [Venturia nashicola]TLD28122.1 hypothetical protein E2P81_ATG06468 [Venturia nashicola]